MNCAVYLGALFGRGFKAFKVHTKTWQNNNRCLSRFLVFFFFCLFLQQVVTVLFCFFLSQATLDKTSYLIAKKAWQEKVPRGIPVEFRYSFFFLSICLLFQLNFSEVVPLSFVLPSSELLKAYLKGSTKVW